MDKIEKIILTLLVLAIAGMTIIIIIASRIKETPIPVNATATTEYKIEYIMKCPNPTPIPPEVKII